MIGRLLAQVCAQIDIVGPSWVGRGDRLIRTEVDEALIMILRQARKWAEWPSLSVNHLKRTSTAHKWPACMSSSRRLKAYLCALAELTHESQDAFGDTCERWKPGRWTRRRTDDAQAMVAAGLPRRRTGEPLITRPHVHRHTLTSRIAVDLYDRGRRPTQHRHAFGQAIYSTHPLLPG